MVTEASISRLENDFKFIDGALQIVSDEKPVHYDYAVDEAATIIHNDSAFVIVKTVADGTEMKVLLLQEDADWKIDLNWDENMMNAATKEVTDQALKIMRNKIGE